MASPLLLSPSCALPRIPGPISSHRKIPFWSKNPRLLFLSSKLPLRNAPRFSAQDQEEQAKPASSVAVAPDEEIDRKPGDSEGGEGGGAEEEAKAQQQQEMDWKADEEFKKFMGNPSIEAAIKLEKKRADRKLRALDRESDGNPITGFFRNVVRDSLTKEKERLEKAEEAFKALDLNKLRSCFGFDTFFAVDVRRFGDGGIFVGNLRKPIEEVMPKLEKKLSEAAGRDVVLWFMEEKKDDITKQVDSPYVKEQKKLLGAEVVAWSKGVVGEGPKPVVISGPSGVGKGTLISKLMKEFPTTFGFSVSHTSRAPREKEMDGVHYHFTERSIMEREIRDGKFLESALVHGNLYGTSIEAVEAVTDAGKRCILDIDVQGARSVRSSSLEALFIFICPPSFEELEKRLRSRGTETEEQVQKRLRNARAELEEGESPGLFDRLLVNDDLETCYENLKKLLMLGDGTNANYQPTLRSFEIPMSHLVSIKDQKILMHSGTSELGKAITSLFLLDVSSLKGGSPGRTRGLGVYAIDSYAE